jgi:hypothetical protein
MTASSWPYLRGAVRGLDHPIHEDGRPWDGEVGHA